MKITSTCALSGILVSCFVVALDAGDDARAIITKAIQAHGGADKVARLQVSRLKGKGTLTANNQSAEFTAEFITSGRDAFRLNLTLDLNMNPINFVQVHKGTQAWQKIAEQVEEVKDERLAEQLMRTHTHFVTSLTPLLKDKSYELSPLGEVQINDRPALGVRVSAKNLPDFNLFFDKATGLLAKTERRGLDLNKKDVARDTYYSDYKDFDGVKHARKMLVNYDGERFLEMDVTGLECPESIPDAEFVQP